MEPTDATRRSAPGVLGVLSEPLGPELVREQLREVLDPELGVNIVDLGLVYEIAVDADGLVAVEMTLTTPGCPLGGFLDDEIRTCLTSLPQVRDVRVELVWDPPWAPEAMSDAAKAQLGWR
ncbi:MAG TPA: metal-sulfur cluster assembly factor [Solirubrobacteraceae bacterium]|nr:metal-sulfur cluster assembly factor [Solirubrobacteraceae bacterium]